MGSTRRSTSSPLNPSLSTILHDFLLDIRSGEGGRLPRSRRRADVRPRALAPSRRRGGRRSPRVAGGLTPWRRPCELRPQRPPGNTLIGPPIHSDDDAARAREVKGLAPPTRGSISLQQGNKQTRKSEKKRVPKNIVKQITTRTKSDPNRIPPPPPPNPHPSTRCPRSQEHTKANTR